MSTRLLLAFAACLLSVPAFAAPVLRISVRAGGQSYTIKQDASGPANLDEDVASDDGESRKRMQLQLQAAPSTAPMRVGFALTIPGAGYVYNFASQGWVELVEGSAVTVADCQGFRVTFRLSGSRSSGRPRNRERVVRISSDDGQLVCRQTMARDSLGDLTAPVSIGSYNRQLQLGGAVDRTEARGGIHNHFNILLRTPEALDDFSVGAAAFLDAGESLEIVDCAGFKVRVGLTSLGPSPRSGRNLLAVGTVSENGAAANCRLVMGEKTTSSLTATLSVGDLRRNLLLNVTGTPPPAPHDRTKIMTSHSVVLKARTGAVIMQDRTTGDLPWRDFGKAFAAGQGNGAAVRIAVSRLGGE